MKPFVAIGGVSDVVQHAETYYISVEATAKGLIPYWLVES